MKLPAEFRLRFTPASAFAVAKSSRWWQRKPQEKWIGCAMGVARTLGIDYVPDFFEHEWLVSVSLTYSPDAIQFDTRPCPCGAGCAMYMLGSWTRLKANRDEPLLVYREHTRLGPGSNSEGDDFLREVFRDKSCSYFVTLTRGKEI